MRVSDAAGSRGVLDSQTVELTLMHQRPVKFFQFIHRNRSQAVADRPLHVGGFSVNFLPPYFKGGAENAVPPPPPRGGAATAAAASPPMSAAVTPVVHVAVPAPGAAPLPMTVKGTLVPAPGMPGQLGGITVAGPPTTGSTQLRANAPAFAAGGATSPAPSSLARPKASPAVQTVSRAKLTMALGAMSKPEIEALLVSSFHSDVADTKESFRAALDAVKKARAPPTAAVAAAHSWGPPTTAAPNPMAFTVSAGAPAPGPATTGASAGLSMWSSTAAIGQPIKIGGGGVAGYHGGSGASPVAHSAPAFAAAGLYAAPRIGGGGADAEDNAPWNINTIIEDD